MKGKESMTLDRVLSRFGPASRTLACTWIAEGRVKVNGRVVRNPETWIHPGRDALHLDGKRLKQARRIHLPPFQGSGPHCPEPRAALRLPGAIVFAPMLSLNLDYQLGGTGIPVHV
jgi:hypothetical protein